MFEYTDWKPHMEVVSMRLRYLTAVVALAAVAAQGLTAGTVLPLLQASPSHHADRQHLADDPGYLPDVTDDEPYATIAAPGGTHIETIMYVERATPLEYDGLVTDDEAEGIAADAERPVRSCNYVGFAQEVVKSLGL